MIAVTELPAVLAIVNGVLWDQDVPMPPSEWNGHPLTCQAENCRGGEIQYPEWQGHTERCPECVDGHPIIDVRETPPLRGYQDAQPWPGYRTVRASLHVVPMWPHQTPPTGRYAIIAVQVP